MTETVSLVKSPQMGCMEVWGGNRPTASGLSMPGLDVWVWSRTEGHTASGGGDLHYLSSCASGRITRMLIADICACGTVFSELATELRELMMHNVNAVKQARFVRDMNDRLQSYSDRGGYATVLLSTYFAPTKSFTLCNAGHPPPLIYRLKDRSWSTMKQAPINSSATAKLPAGVMGSQEYHHFNSRLELGDMVFSYSNELAECRDQHGKTLGVDGILKRVEELDAGQPEKIIETVVSDLLSERAENLAKDDATILLCRAAKTGVGWKNNLLAPFRLFGSVRNNTHVDA